VCTVSPKKGGALRNQSTGGRRLGVAAALCGAVIGVPLLLLQSASAHASRPQAAAGGAHENETSAVHSSSHADGVRLPSNLVAYQAPTTTSTTAAATTTTTAPPTTTTTAAPAPAPALKPTTTTTTAPPPPPTTTTTTAPPVAAATSNEGGEATWYAAAPAGYCASPTLSFGTELTVVNNATGASTVCTVDDREAAGYPRVVDLSPEGFAQIADTSQGVVDVTISW
jgi:rare lipoprotein A (peptidoglycan hydrolase)